MSGTPASITLRCPTCGYNLTGLTRDVCPECGAAFDPEALRTGNVPPPRGSVAPMLIAPAMAFLIPILIGLTPIQARRVVSGGLCLMTIASALLSSMRYACPPKLNGGCMLTPNTAAMALGMCCLQAIGFAFMFYCGWVIAGVTGLINVC